MSTSTARESRLLKVILLGDGGVGKSSLMTRFIHNRFDAHCYHTIGVEFLNKEIVVDGVTYTLQIWDTAGQERFRALRTPFYRGSDICLLTFSVDDATSFRNLNMWQNEFLYYGDVPDNQPFPFLLLGNKCDVSVGEREVTSEAALTWCAQGGVRNVSANSPQARTAIAGQPHLAGRTELPPGSTGQSAPPNSHSNALGNGNQAANTSSLYVIPYVETSAKDAINVEEGFRRAVQVWQQWDQMQHHRVGMKHEEWDQNNIHLEGSKRSSISRRGNAAANSSRRCCS